MNTTQIAMDAMAKQIEDLKKELKDTKAQAQEFLDGFSAASDLFILAMNVIGKVKQDELFFEMFEADYDVDSVHGSRMNEYILEYFSENRREDQ